jgi:hypothetical protein
MLQVLAERGPDLGGSPWHLYRGLQYGSSVVGMPAAFMALCLWVRHARRPNPPPEWRLPVRERHRWVAVYILIPVVLVGVAVVQIHHNGWPLLYSTAALTLLSGTGINGAALALIFSSALIRRRLLILGARHLLPEGS